jgi:hypothetical protein
MARGAVAFEVIVLAYVIFERGLMRWRGFISNGFRAWNMVPPVAIDPDRISKRWAF